MAPNAEHDPTQAQQNEIAAKSPVKTPAAGDTPGAETQAKEFSSTKVPVTPNTVAAKNPAPLPSVTLPEEPVENRDDGDPVARASKRIVPIDVWVEGATDSTVDSDGKGLEAIRDESMWHDNVIYSNASSFNSVPVPSEGIVNFDSRPAGTMPLIATRAGWRVVYQGTVEVPDPISTHTDLRLRWELVFSLEPASNQK
jgi:hypothetical protein